MTEIRYRTINHYINDLASSTRKVPEAVFAFTLDELEALESWVPWDDGFHKEILEAKEELERRGKCIDAFSGV